MTAPGNVILVAPDSQGTSGHLTWRGRRYRCALGKGGVRRDKREGDGATPVGRFALRRALFRPDRFGDAPATRLPVTAIRPEDGWCDDPGDAAYNRPVVLPYPASAERMWRDDDLYDVVVVLGHNDDPPVPGQGSAIFLHVARPDFGPTEGCVALPLPALLAILAECDETTALEVTAAS